MPKLILDEFTRLPNRFRRIQLRRKWAHRCRDCGKPAQDGLRYCLDCACRNRERMRANIHCHRRNKHAKTYWLQNQAQARQILAEPSEQMGEHPGQFKPGYWDVDFLYRTKRQSV